MSTEPVERIDAAAPTSRPSRLGCAKSLSRLEREIERLERRGTDDGAEVSTRLSRMRGHLAELMERAYSAVGGWQTVELARHSDRPVLADYIRLLVRDYCELHGDRCFGDDRAILTGWGRIGGRRVMLLGHNKGREIEDRVACCFGYPHPEGYRKALRAMRLAEKFDVPVVSLIDTPGAHPGVGAEERGVAEAIAVNLREMSRLRVPVVCVVIGEGGSGGALGIGVGDLVGMLQHAYYSVITPEGCASILFHDVGRARQAAEALRLTAEDLKRFHLIDEIIEEPLGGAHRDMEGCARGVERFIRDSLRELATVTRETLLVRRCERLRDFGAEFIRPALAATEAP